MSNGRLPFEDNSDWCESLPKRVSHDSRHFIFRPAKKKGRFIRNMLASIGLLYIIRYITYAYSTIPRSWIISSRWISIISMRAFYHHKISSSATSFLAHLHDCDMAKSRDKSGMSCKGADRKCLEWSPSTTSRKLFPWSGWQMFISPIALQGRFCGISSKSTNVGKISINSTGCE